RHIGGEQGAGAAEGSVGLRGRAERLAEIAPHRGRDHPADQIDIGEHRERQNKNEKTDDDGEPVLADPRRGFARAPGRARGSRFDGRLDVLVRQRATAMRVDPAIIARLAFPQGLRRWWYFLFSYGNSP